MTPTHVYQQLDGQPRDNYQGKFLPAIADVSAPFRVIHMRRSGNIVLVAIADSNNVDLWRVSNPDDHRLQLLGCDDRGQVQGLLISIKREAGDAA